MKAKTNTNTKENSKMAALVRHFINRLICANKTNYCQNISICRAMRSEVFAFPTISSSTIFGNRSFSKKVPEKKESKDDVKENEEGQEGQEAPAQSLKIKRRPVHDVQTSIRYLESKAYQITYRDALVWEPYRRNHKGSIPPEKTRRTCVRGGVITTGNPCPICRDEYLVLHPQNVKLLKQFISPFTGDAISYQKTGLCQVQHKNLLVAIQQAWDLGYVDMPLPFREYDYKEYYPKSRLAEEQAENTKTATT